MSAAPVKPRPRPRPRPRNTSSTPEVDKPGSSSKSPLEDEDAMFIRNRNRNASSWNKLNKAVEKHEAVRAESLDLSDSDESPRAKRTRRAPFEPKPKELPAWARSDGFIQLNDSDSDHSKNDSDPDDLYIDSQKSNDRHSSQKSPESKRKRRRSRSRSDSDDSDVADAEVQYAELAGRERARQVLGSQPLQREKSPIYTVSDDDEADDTTELPAELAAIRAEVKKNTARAASADNAASTSAAATVELTIILRPHPEDESGKSYVYSHTMKRNEKFEQLFSDIADAAGIPSERLIVLHNNHRVYRWSSPQTLSIWSSAELIAYEEHVYKYIKEHGEYLSPISNTIPESTLDPSTNDYHEEILSPEPNPAQSQPGGTFKLQVRVGEQTVTVSVRQTTKCSAIVEKVLAKMGKPAKAAQKARIEVDGEKLDPDSEIGIAELEDGDLIDIVGA